jgi:hypothetical protein
MARPAGSDDVDRRARNLKVKRECLAGAANAVRPARRSATHGEPDAGALRRGPRMRCGWGCGAVLTGSSKGKRGHPPGRRMLCGWRFGTVLTASQMRAHFTTCPKRPAASGHVDRQGTNIERGRPASAANAVRLGLSRRAKNALALCRMRHRRRTCARLCHGAGGEREQFLLGHVSIRKQLCLGEQRIETPVVP